MKKKSPIINASELLALYTEENIVIVDARTGENAKENYLKKHLDKALFIDLNTQLAAIKSDHAIGGRHPLPDVLKFIDVLEKMGINEKSHVVIYDDKFGANAAARFWWMLKAVGHEKAQVLNGGIQEAEKKGFPMSSEIATPKAAKYEKVADWQLPIAAINEVEVVSENEKYLVIDVRENSRYNGENEPIDLIAGHIPGAINIPFTSNLNEEGLFLSPSELKTKYNTVFGERSPEHIIVHCGSGVTACHTLLAMHYAGLEIPKLYVGSWSEWSRNNKAIATKIGE